VPAQVVGVTDGDTITAIVDGRQIKVRLNGIDAPEKKQAFGNVSKQALSGLVFGKRVSIVDLGKDRYGRTIGEVFTPDGQQVEVAMVRLGFAWHYVKYAPRNTDRRCGVGGEEGAAWAVVGCCSGAALGVQEAVTGRL
jgi:endonuclease YncB( thermonuclease family)